MSVLKRLLILAFVAAALGGCADEKPIDVLVGAAKNMARSACEEASNCVNTCPSGEEAEEPFYTCRDDP